MATCIQPTLRISMKTKHVGKMDRKTPQVKLEKIMGRWDTSATCLEWENGTKITQAHYWCKYDILRNTSNIHRFVGLDVSSNRWLPESALLRSPELRKIVQDFNAYYTRDRVSTGLFKVSEGGAEYIIDYDAMEASRVIKLEKL